MVKGYTQTFGIELSRDFCTHGKDKQCLNPIVSYNNFLLASTTVRCEECLNGKLEDEDYMDLPPSFEGTLGSNKVCKL